MCNQRNFFLSCWGLARYCFAAQRSKNVFIFLHVGWFLYSRSIIQNDASQIHGMCQMSRKSYDSLDIFTVALVGSQVCSRRQIKDLYLWTNMPWSCFRAEKRIVHLKIFNQREDGIQNIWVIRVCLRKTEKILLNSSWKTISLAVVCWSFFFEW